MPSLRLSRRESPDEYFPLCRDETILGKGPECDVRLPDQRVSKRHARIERRGEGFFIEDLKSTNNTYVRGETVVGARRLEDGDVIEIIHYRLEYLRDDPPASEAATILGTVETLAPAGRPAAGERLRVLMRVGRDLVGILDDDDALEAALAALLRIFPQAERGLALFRDERDGSLVTRACKLRHPEAGVRATASRVIYEHVTESGLGVLCEDAAADGRFRESRSVAEARVRTMMCAPLWGRGHRPVGILQVDTHDVAGRFRREDLDFLVAIAGTVSLAVENARLHAVEVLQGKIVQEGLDAQAVQRSLIPERSPGLPGYEFWHAYEPALFVGGDYFDYRPLGRGSPAARSRRWAIALGDVEGKGMPAALLMARLSSEVRLLLQARADPVRVVEGLNRGLCEANTGRHATFLLAMLDGRRHDLTVVNAGHMGPMVRRADGTIEVIGQEQNGLMLGVSEGAGYGAVTSSIGPGDVVVLYTDGVSEAMSPGGRRFGVERLRRALASPPPGAGPAGEAIREAVRRHAAGRDQSDDITLLCFGRP
jgi:serine phosphatase RsbU (regulator of sigma subunit)